MNSSVTPWILLGSSLSGSSWLPASSSSKCAKCTAGFFQEWLVTLRFPQGQETGSPQFGGTISSLGFWGLRATLSNLPSQPPWQPLGSLSMSSPADLPSGRLPLLLITGEVCHRSNLSSTPPHNLGENNQGRKWLKPGDALKGKCPSLTPSPYLPFVIRIAPGSAHQVLSCCYNVHPRLSTHHPRLYPYQSSISTLWDSLARLKLHRVVGCDPCTLHIDILLNPTSNSGRLLHLWHPHPWRWGGFIFMWGPFSQCCLPLLGCQDPFDLSDLDDIEEAIDNELWLLLNPWSGEGEGNWCDWGLWSPPTSIMFLAFWGLMRWQLMTGTTIPRHILQRGTSWGIKLEGLLGWQIHTGTSWSPCLNSTIWYGLSNGPSTSLDCHGVCGKVGQFSNPHTCSCE